MRGALGGRHRVPRTLSGASASGAAVDPRLCGRVRGPRRPPLTFVRRSWQRPPTVPSGATCNSRDAREPSRLRVGGPRRGHAVDQRRYVGRGTRRERPRPFVERAATRRLHRVTVRQHTARMAGRVFPYSGPGADGDSGQHTHRARRAAVPDATRTGPRVHDRIAGGVMTVTDTPGDLADPGGLRPAQGRARRAHRRTARSIAAEINAAPRGGRPQGERRLPRRPRGAGQAGGPHPPAPGAAAHRRRSASARPTTASSRPAWSSPVRYDDDDDDRDVPARLPRGGRARRPRGVLAAVAARRGDPSAPSVGETRHLPAPDGGSMKVTVSSTRSRITG